MLDKKFKYTHFSHFHSLIWLDKRNLWKRIYSFLPPFISFYSFPQLLLLIPVGWYILCKHIINFFQIWNWVKIFHSQLNVSLDSLALKIISNNHRKLVSLSLVLTKVKSGSFIKIFWHWHPFPVRPSPTICLLPGLSLVSHANIWCK